MAKQAARPGAGRPRWQPTDADRLRAETLGGLGVPQDQIALLIGVTTNTLRKYLMPELKLGHAKATSQVAQTLYNRATKGNDLGAAIFWLKSQAGWREVQRVETTGADGAPIASTITYKWQDAPKTK